MIINEMNINTLGEKYYKVQTQNWAHTSFSVMNAFSMRLAAEVVLNSFKTMILINIVDHPTKLVNIFALVPCVVCNNSYADACFVVAVVRLGCFFGHKSFCRKKRI